MLIVDSLFHGEEKSTVLQQAVFHATGLPVFSYVTPDTAEWRSDEHRGRRR